MTNQAFKYTVWENSIEFVQHGTDDLKEAFDFRKRLLDEGKTAYVLNSVGVVMNPPKEADGNQTFEYTIWDTSTEFAMAGTDDQDEAHAICQQFIDEGGDAYVLDSSGTLVEPPSRERMRG